MSETPTEPAVEPDDEPLEALDPDEPADDLDEPELEPAGDEPELEPAGDEPSTQALLQGLEREYSRHQKAIAKALGIELEQMHECPTCEGVGFTPEPIDAPPPLVQDPFTETCGRCAGNGKTKSGASPLGLYEIPCGGCGGSGYVTKAEQPDAGAGFGAVPAGAPYTPPPPVPAAMDGLTIAEARAQGYMIVEPIVVPQASPA